MSGDPISRAGAVAPTTPADTDPTAMGAIEIAAAIAAGTLTSTALVEACLARIDTLEPSVRAFVHLDRDAALRQAATLDDGLRRSGSAGPLHGIPVGVKDIIDTGDMPTECGTPLLAGRRPRADATVVRRLREAGAVLPGKTVTTEFATYRPAATRNPWRIDRTPGGSSSGSAAAVAAGMVPLAVGTQTNGSVIRPAAYCGVVGFKPTFGTISRAGILRTCRELDQVGVFARNVEDAALLAEALMGEDSDDPDTRPVARPWLTTAVAREPAAPPTLAFVPGPAWEPAEADTRVGIEDLRRRLGDRVVEAAMPVAFDGAYDLHRIIMETGIAHHIGWAADRDGAAIGDGLREQIARGRRYGAAEFIRAREAVAPLHDAIAPLFEGACALLTPAVAGEPPPAAESTGSPTFCTPWTLLGLPCLSLPLLTGSHGLPIGVQLVGAAGDDARLLQTGRWLMAELGVAPAVAPMTPRRSS
jgi:Asp-tRNA(Asn)/Glu-tRNA(Gln) amidotransferase A subunit family amidase